MKQLFALFCALVLLPSFSAHAWIGGPFSNNTFFGENGDDGVYSASASGPNAIGLFRFTVANNFAGSQEIATDATETVIYDVFGVPITTITTPGINSGNLAIGGFGSTTNIWFVEGVSYTGSTLGNVDSVSGAVFAVGTASDGAGTAALSSAFQGALNRSGQFLPSSSFTGVGEGAIDDGTTISFFGFTVFGSKVSDSILFGL
ncbi:MAG: hypothetical protein P1U68_01535 [Verrucomicrobiales bacterium]|nr:hypothetical protein [Verrucomicrobiales bacterium]